MSDAIAAPAGRAAPRHRRAAALTALVRDRLARGSGVRAARLLATAAGAALFTGALLLRRGGDDLDPALVVASGLRVAIAVASGVAALAVARTPRAGDELPAIEALAVARGLRPGATAAALVIAAARTVQRATALPVAIAAIATGLASRPQAFTLLVAAGGAAWAWLAAGVLGAIAGACRRAAGPRGRSLFLAVVLGPWLVADGLLDARAAAWLSVPGWLDWAWHLLTGVRG